MGKSRLLKLAALLVALSVRAPAQNEDSQSSGRAAGRNEIAVREALQQRVAELVVAEQWDEVESMAAQLRKSRVRWPGGMPKLDDFYVGVRRPFDGATDRDFETVRARAERWLKAKPESVPAHVALAWTHYNHAWLARGGNAAASVSPENWKRFGERLEKVRGVLRDAEKLPVRDAELYVVGIRAASSESGASREVMDLHRKAVELDPSYYRAYFETAYRMVPRWGSELGAWAKFADESAKRTMAEEGMSLYARIVWSMTRSWKDREMVQDEWFFERNRVSWPKTRQGFIDLEARYPGSTVTLNTFCSLACLADDRETAAPLFAKIGSDPDMTVWRTPQRLERWQLWADPATPKALLSPTKSFDATVDTASMPPWISTVKLSPDGKSLAVATGSRIDLWDLASGKSRRIVAGEEVTRRDVAFSPDGKLLATTEAVSETDSPGVVRLWDAASGAPVSTLTGAAHVVAAVLFSPDGTRLYATGGDWVNAGEVNVWNVADWTRKPVKLDTKRAHWYPALSRDGGMLALNDGSWITVLDTASGKVIKKGAVDPRNAVTTLSFSPDGHDLAFSTSAGRIGIVDPRTLKERQTQAAAGHGNIVFGMAHSPDGRLLITSGADGAIRYWDAVSGAPVATSVGHAGRAAPLDISGDGRILVSGGADGQVKVWDVESVLRAAAERRAHAKR